MDKQDQYGLAAPEWLNGAARVRIGSASGAFNCLAILQQLAREDGRAQSNQKDAANGQLDLWPMQILTQELQPSQHQKKAADGH